MNIISVRKNPKYLESTIAFFQKTWPSVPPMIYADCISHSLTSTKPLPQWYLLEKEDQIIGGAGLVTNDFISRMDLYPWLCALYIEKKQRGNNHAKLLIDQAKQDAELAGFDALYVSTDHIGYYEKFNFEYIG